ncbi:hypothetical protein [Peribacillus sp. V2I11]|uniref:hypothetical protein n=1 Tax=Peribacillus sp. V2I11 TaxID=3042277 RepID=UPI002786F0F8|nr:hypothetical protein [Peribacillus sp. V2I11]MDQ0884892.1 hypothetical protein [Peribacillus sp. V2I11]
MTFDSRQEIALRSHDISIGLGTKEVPEFETLTEVGIINLNCRICLVPDSIWVQLHKHLGMQEKSTTDLYAARLDEMSYSFLGCTEIHLYKPFK